MEAHLSHLLLPFLRAPPTQQVSGTHRLGAILGPRCVSGRLMGWLQEINLVSGGGVSLPSGTHSNAVPLLNRREEILLQGPGLGWWHGAQLVQHTAVAMVTLLLFFRRRGRMDFSFSPNHLPGLPPFCTLWEPDSPAYCLLLSAMGESSPAPWC